MLDSWVFLGVLYIYVELCDSVTAGVSLEDCPLGATKEYELWASLWLSVPSVLSASLYAPCCFASTLKTLFVASRLSVFHSDLPLSFCDIER